MRKALKTGVVGLAVVGLLSAAPAAFADGRGDPGSGAGPRVIQRGTCGRNHWSLELTPHSSRIEADLEFHTPRAGVHYRVVMRDNGTVFWSGRKTTEQDGSFSVDRYTHDQAGTDKVTAKVKNVSTGAVCKATASIG